MAYLGSASSPASCLFIVDSADDRSTTAWLYVNADLVMGAVLRTLPDPLQLESGGVYYMVASEQNGEVLLRFSLAEAWLGLGWTDGV